MKTVFLAEESVHAGNLVLVNARYSCREGGAAGGLVPVNDAQQGVLLDVRAVRLLSKLMEELDGWRQITAVSGWRSREEQEGIYGQSLKENGAGFTSRFVALPDHSEHQTGLAVDLGLKQDDIDFIRPDFPYTGICGKFRERAVPYGFIERYPEGKEGVTGIAHEPWHFRYVGTPHAEIMAKHGFVLEEYIDFLKQYPYGGGGYSYPGKCLGISVSYLRAEKGADTRLDVEEDVPYAVSGNNVDGYVITTWHASSGRGIGGRGVPWPGKGTGGI